MRERAFFVCRECGYEAPRWLGRCPGCAAWNALEEVRTRSGPRGTGAGSVAPAVEPVPLGELDAPQGERLGSGMDDLDAVLGGGLVPGSLCLLGGDPGVGKSTLLLQLCLHLAAGAAPAPLHDGRARGPDARAGRGGPGGEEVAGGEPGPVLYVTGEESPRQVRLRAERLRRGRPLPDRLLILPSTDLEEIEAAVSRLRPAFLAVDSVQTVAVPGVEASPGSVAQVREAAARFLRLAKGEGVTTWLVGHINKDGVLAGPKVLEHLVDVVLYLEGERYGAHRVLRSAKNRFGPTSEVAVLTMSGDGLAAVANPSALFLSERAAESPGSAVAVTCEGERAFLVEVQALVSRAAGVPRRVAQGVDAGRVAVILAVLERRAGLPLGQHDAYVKVAGGFRLEEPAADLAVALALASSFYDVPVDPGLAVAAEVGLAGELRAVGRVEARVREAERLGFRGLLAAPAEVRGLPPARRAATGPARSAVGGAALLGASNLTEAMRLALAAASRPAADEG